MSDLSRRGFLGSMGAVALGFLFRGKGGALVPEPVQPKQAPSACTITAMPQMAFRPERIVVPAAIAPLFVIEDIMIGGASQFAESDNALPAEMFSADAMSPSVMMDPTSHNSSEIKFRVRYVGEDPKGARFYASIIGRTMDSSRMAILPIDSGVAIVA